MANKLHNIVNSTSIINIKSISINYQPATVEELVLAG